MTNYLRSEFIFIGVMTVFLLIFAFFAVYMFFRQFKKEKAGQAELNAKLLKMKAEREARQGKR